MNIPKNMKKINNKRKHYWRNLALRVLLVLITAVLIVLFLPRTTGKMFHYDEGKPWMYGQLIAKFDFPIFKTDEALKNERDSIMKNFSPYFNISPSIEKKNIDQFRAAYKGGIPNLPPQYVDAVANRLHELYQAGIVNTDQFSTLLKDSGNIIHVVAGKQAISEPVSKIYTTLGATRTSSPTLFWGPNATNCSGATSMNI